MQNGVDKTMQTVQILQTVQCYHEAILFCCLKNCRIKEILLKKYYSIPNAAKMCSVNSSTMYRWVTAGKIESHRTPGGHHRIAARDLKKWMEDHRIPYDSNEFGKDKTLILFRKFVLVSEEK